MTKLSQSQLIQIYKAETIEALATLSHSWLKLKSKRLPDIQNKNLDDLEPWEALTARFARTTDIYLSKYIRLRIIDADPTFRGETRDLLDRAEKMALISGADQWMEIRELRNKIAHEYHKEDLLKTFSDILKLTPFVLNELKGLSA